MNCTALGDSDSADRFLDLEIEAQTEDLRGIAQRKTSYYKEHYTVLQQIIGRLRLILRLLRGFVWGYGRQLLGLAISYVIITTLFACITYFSHISLLSTSSSQPVILSFWDAFLHAFGKTLGGVVSFGEPVSTFGRVLQISEGLTGACFLALLYIRA
jgi:hypothetical protein